MRRLRVYARIARVLLVVGLGLSMATVFGVFERLGMAHSMERRQRWSRFFMARLSNALPFDVTVQGELPKTSMLWVSNHVSWTDIPLLGMLTPLSFLSKAEVRTWPVAGWLAAISSSLYLVHKAVFHLLETAWGPALEGRGLVAFCAYGVAALLAGGALYYAVERPFLRLRERMPVFGRAVDAPADAIKPFGGADAA